MQAKSVHDNLLLGYTVDCSSRHVTLRTVFREREPHEYTDIVFKGVVAYHFEGDTFGTIIFDVAEATIEDLLTPYGDVFVRLRDYGWPPVRHQTPEQLVEALRDRNVKGFLVSSSCGMSGFVLAQSVEVSDGGPPPDPPAECW